MNIADFDYLECSDTLQELVRTGLENVENCMISLAHCDYYLDTHPDCTPEQYDEYRVSKGMVSSLRDIKRAGLHGIRSESAESWHYLNTAHACLTQEYDQEDLP